MFKKPLILLVLAAACCAAQAQSSPAKKELVARILKVQQAGIEQLARGLAEEPARNLLAHAEQAMGQRVPADKQPAVAKEIDGDVKKYLDDAVPLLRERAVKLAPSTIGTLLEDKFSEDELKQVIGFLESPAYLKYQQLGPEMQKVLVEKVVADARPAMEQKVRALDQALARRLGVSEAPGTAAGSAAAASSAAKAPAKKR